MASKFVADLQRNGTAVNDHGVTISTVDQGGSYSGQSVGRVWWNQPNTRGASRWHWIGVGSTYQAAIEAKTLKGLTYEQIMEKY